MAAKFRVRKWMAVVAVVACLALLIGVRLFTVPDVLIPTGHELTSDDFGVIVVRAQRKEGGVVLRVRISNHARGVPFTYSPSMVLVNTRDGRQLTLSEEDSRREEVLVAGQSVEEDLHFLDAGTEGPYNVRFQISGPSGEFMESLLSIRQHSEVSLQ